VLLRRAGYEVELVSGVRLALERLQKPEPMIDLVVTDLAMPDGSGMQVLEAAKRNDAAVQVIMITAFATTEQAVEAMRLGAYDYVQKPFGLHELIARIHAVLRRRQAHVPATTIFGDVTVDRRARTVQRAGEDVSLSPREMSLLMFFLEHPGRAMTRDALLEGAWGLDYEGTERTIDNFVVSLRKKLEKDPESPKHFVTVRGTGYRFDP
jgi:DNA-binding response OmpR family regulator